MGFTTDLLAGLAQLLEDEGVGAWRPDGSAYLADETAIVLRSMPQSPTRVVSLSDFAVSDDRALNDSTVGVQAMTRAGPDPRDVEGLDDELFDVLHGMTSVVLGGVHVVQVYRQSRSPLGADGNGRQQSSSNFYFDVARPSRHRTD